MRFRAMTLRSMRSRTMSLPARPLLVARVTGVLAVTLGGFAPEGNAEYALWLPKPPLAVSLALALATGVSVVSAVRTRRIRLEWL